jgi:hypothetical protein
MTPAEIQKYAAERYRTAAQQAHKGACRWAKNAFEDAFRYQRMLRESYIGDTLFRYMINADRAYAKNCGDGEHLMPPHLGKRKKRDRPAYRLYRY